MPGFARLTRLAGTSDDVDRASDAHSEQNRYHDHVREVEREAEKGRSGDGPKTCQHERDQDQKHIHEAASYHGDDHDDGERRHENRLRERLAHDLRGFRYHDGNACCLRVNALHACDERLQLIAVGSRRGRKHLHAYGAVRREPIAPDLVRQLVQRHRQGSLTQLIEQRRQAARQRPVQRLKALWRLPCGKIIERGGKCPASRTSDGKSAATDAATSKLALPCSFTSPSRSSAASGSRLVRISDPLELLDDR